MAGICADCNRPVEGRVGSAVRCAEHKKARTAEFYRAYRRDNPQKVRASARRYYKSDKVRRKARAEYKRAWRKANRDKVRAQKRRSALRGVTAKAQQRHRDKIRLLRNTEQSTPAPRTCLTCPTVVHGRVKKCVMCKAREALIAKDHLSLGRGRGWRAAA
jgi:ATPase subunit of ABC transporter with duplicated ATPase domains